MSDMSDMSDVLYADSDGTSDKLWVISDQTEYVGNLLIRAERRILDIFESLSENVIDDIISDYLEYKSRKMVMANLQIFSL